MSFLPYSSSTGGWLWATIGSTFAHAGIIVGALGFYSEVLARQEDAPQQRQFTVTLERLDADTLAGITEQDGVAGGEDEADPTESLSGLPDYDAPDSAEAETAEPVSSEELEPDQSTALDPVEPDSAMAEEIEELEPTETEELEPEMPEQIAPEALEGTEELAALDPAEGLEPEGIDPAETEMPDAVVPDTVTGDALTALDDPSLAGTADTVAPVSPIMAPEQSSPLIPETVVAGAAAPLAPTGGGAAPQTVTGTTTATTTVVGGTTASVAAAPAQDPTEAAPGVTDAAESVAALNSTPPATPNTEGEAQRPSRPPPSARDLALGDLIRRIRAAAADPCLLALPRRDGEDGIGLALIAARDSAIQDFSDTALTAEDADIRQTRTLVDQRQCPALTFVRQNQDYPATRLGLRIDDLELQSGETLTGVLRGTAGRYVTLLLIDDNGVVQDLQRFMAFSGNIARFDVPVSRNGPARDTSQILLAIATRAPPGPIKSRVGELAQEVFAGLEGELASGAAIAIETFDVR